MMMLKISNTINVILIDEVQWKIQWIKNPFEKLPYCQNTKQVI